MDDIDGYDKKKKERKEKKENLLELISTEKLQDKKVIYAKMNFLHANDNQLKF